MWLQCKNKQGKSGERRSRLFALRLWWLCLLSDAMSHSLFFWGYPLTPLVLKLLFSSLSQANFLLLVIMCTLCAYFKQLDYPNYMASCWRAIRFLALALLSWE